MACFGVAIYQRCTKTTKCDVEHVPTIESHAQTHSHDILIDYIFIYVLTAAIKQMLNLNTTQSKSLAAEPVWKVLIYDKVGQDIISPLLSIKEIRELGVTLHM